MRRSLQHGQTDHSRDNARRPAPRRSHGDEFATTKETMMRTTFTAVLVAYLGLIAVSATASAQWRSSYVSYYDGSDIHRGNWMDRASQSFSGGGY